MPDEAAGPSPDNASLEGCSVVVTGAASGIGRATARLFAGRGAAVAAVDVDPTVEAIAAEMVERGGSAIAVVADVSKSADCRAVVDRVVGAFGTVDVLFNNAGIVCRSDVVDTSEATWDRVMAVNVKSIYLMSRGVIPVMRRAGGGAIINTASGWGLAAGPRAAAYCASKGAVVQLTRAMAIDHAADGIRVNCICPGDVDTPMLAAEAADLGEPDERFLDAAKRRPIARVGRPEEVAEAALYLASSGAAFVTGASLVIDGGGLLG